MAAARCRSCCRVHGNQQQGPNHEVRPTATYVR
jgi:hypothetical protein